MWTKIALAVSLAANVALGAFFYTGPNNPRAVLAKLRAYSSAETQCKTKIAARDRQWLLYVATRPAVEVEVVHQEPTVAEQLLIQNLNNLASREMLRPLR